MRVLKKGAPQKGATGTEYAIMISMVSVVALAAALGLGTDVRQVFGLADSSITSARIEAQGPVASTPGVDPGAEVPVEPEPEEPAEPGLGDPMIMTFTGNSARFSGDIDSVSYLNILDEHESMPADHDPRTGLPKNGLNEGALAALAINWGEGAQNCPAVITPDLYQYSCTYEGAGPHTVEVSPVLRTLVGLDASLRSIEDWGDTPLESLDSAFRMTSNLESLPSTLPRTVTSLQYTFKNAPSIPDEISGWGVQNVVSFRQAFDQQVGSAANGREGPKGVVLPDLSQWNPASGVEFYQMFRSATFPITSGTETTDLNAWNMSRAVDLGLMFWESNFNGSVSNWNVSNAVSLSGTFSGAPFNQPLKDWDTRNVQYLGAMFEQNSDFNQDITEWDTSSVIQTAGMFRDASAFNQDIGPHWDMSKNAALSQMFRNATSLSSDFTSWRPVPVERGNINNVFVGSQARGDLRCWNVAHIPSRPNSFGNGASDLQEPLWGQAPRTDCGVALAE